MKELKYEPGRAGGPVPEGKRQTPPEGSGQGAPAMPGRVRLILIGLCWAALFWLIHWAVAQAASAVLAIRMLAETGMDPGAPVDPALLEEVAARAGQMSGGANLLTLLTLVLLFRSRGIPARLGLGLIRPDRASLLPCLLWGVLLNLAVTLAMGFLPQSLLESYQAAPGIRAAMDPGFFTVLTVLLLAPVCEELIFRHLVYGNFRLALPRWAALLLQALIFGLFHGHPVQIIYAFVLALILGLVRERKKTVLASILLHVGFNGANYLYALLIPGL